MANIVTPHAAIIVWNYRDRLGLDPVGDNNAIDKTIISTLSCLSIETSKTKSNPEGNFRIALAPNRNWVSAITPGSWCVILMSNDPITPQDLKEANPSKVRMFGKIDSVRVDSRVDDNGVRKTQYLMTGIDWGHIFNNIIYIDPHLSAEDEARTQGQGFAVALGNILFGNKGTPQSFAVKDNLNSIVNIFGQEVKGITRQGDDINRLANAVYTFNIPKDMVEYFGFVGPDGDPLPSLQLNKLLTLYSGSLTDDDTYNNKSEAEGFIDPFSLQGAHSFWQVLVENSNPALNEMLCDLKWTDSGPQLALYNRIKPFSFRGFGDDAGSSNDLRSFFQFVKTTTLPTDYVVSVNAGTNWRDKYNFVEIKPTFTDFQVFQNWYKREAQQLDKSAFSREGFRPMIVETKQFPKGGASTGQVDFNELASWSKLLQEWFFDTHRMMNGTLTMIGINDYIAVGDNIKFDAKIVNPSHNFTSAQLSSNNTIYLLGHVESINHSFQLSANNAREWITTIQFVRGIFVDKDNVSVNDATLDTEADSMTVAQNKNTVDAFSTSDAQDPDPQKVRGN